MSRNSARSRGRKHGTIPDEFPPVVIHRSPETVAMMLYVMNNPDNLSERDLKLKCPCICHDMGGGNAHQGARCICNGGEGMWP